VPAVRSVRPRIHGGEGCIRTVRLPSRKSLEECDFDHAHRLKRDLIAHLSTLNFVTAKDGVVFLGPPGTGKTHLAIGIAIRACQAGDREGDSHRIKSRDLARVRAITTDDQ
jgi:DNA replication protein DnaC